MIPELTPQENKQFELLLSMAKKEAVPEAAKVKSAYVERTVKQLVEEQGLSKSDARAVAEMRCVQNGILHEKDLIHFRQFGMVPVRDVLADPGKYHNQSCADPLEPEEGTSRAKLYSNSDGSVILSSRLHGGQAFIVRRGGDEEEAPEQPAEKVSLLDAEGNPKSKTTILIEIGSQGDLFHDENGEAYACVKVKGHRETWPVKSSAYGRFLADQYYMLSSKGVSRNVVADATDTLSGAARVRGRAEEVHRRVAFKDDAIYLDMCDERWRVIKVTKSGWNVLSDSPVRFLRSSSSAPFPNPQEGGSLDELWPLVNVREDDRPLIAGFLVRALYPKPPYFAACIVGEQGTAKSSGSTILRQLCDPSTSPLRPPPKDEMDFLAAAVNNRCLAYDNLSGMAPWLSDALCRVLTGGSFARRTLYSTSDETTMPLSRPAVLNGIDDFATRADLADRSLALTLLPVDENDRLEEDELWSRFKRISGRVFGVLLDGLSSALRNKDSVDLPFRPRMVDAAKWATAAEEGLGLKPGSFMEAYARNQREMVYLSLEVSPFTEAVLSMMEKLDSWSGSATELESALSTYARDEDVTKSKAWPKSPAWIGKVLRRYTPALRKVGILVEESRDGVTRSIRITRMTVERKNSTPHGQSKNDNHNPPPNGHPRNFQENTVTTVSRLASNDSNDSKIPEVLREQQGNDNFEVF